MQLVNWSCLDFNLDRLLQSQRLPHSLFPFVSGITKVVEVEVCRGWFSVYFPGIVGFLEYQPERISRFIPRMQAQICVWGKSTEMVCRDELEGHIHHVHVLIWQQTWLWVFRQSWDWGFCLLPQAGFVSTLNPRLSLVHFSPLSLCLNCRTERFTVVWGTLGNKEIEKIVHHM